MCALGFRVGQFLGYNELGEGGAGWEVIQPQHFRVKKTNHIRVLAFGRNSLSSNWDLVQDPRSFIILILIFYKFDSNLPTLKN